MHTRPALIHHAVVCPIVVSPRPSLSECLEKIRSEGGGRGSGGGAGGREGSQREGEEDQPKLQALGGTLISP